MKQYSYLFIFIILGSIFSCSQDIDSKINGQWQLKTITTNDKVCEVDTIFYSFQRGAVFSFTVLHSNGNTESSVYYGYVNVLSDDEFEIFMAEQNKHPSFFDYSGWEDYKNSFVVKSIDRKHMVLSDKEKTYTLKKH